MKTLILIFLLSFHLNAQENASAPTDTRPCKDSMVNTEHFPKNNDLNFQAAWCLFSTSAHLFSFYEEAPLSMYDLALQYFNNDVIRENMTLPENIFDTGGNLTNAFIVGQSSKGICLESQTNFTKSDWTELAVMFKRLTDNKKTLLKIMCEFGYQNTAPFNELPHDILRIINKLSGDKKAAALLDVTCGQRHQFKNKYGVGNRAIEKFPDDKIIEKLDDLLNRKQPASASYDLEFITRDDSYVRDMSEGYVAHAATIIGRRFNKETNKCEYMIKDSVGNRCPKNSIYECDRSTGHMWVPRENLQKNIYEVNWLVKR